MGAARAPLGLVGEALDAACLAVGDFADLKSPFTLGHSRGVAELAEAAAWRMGLGEDDVDVVRRAGLLHDVGRVAVSNGVWDKPAPLTAASGSACALHTYYTSACWRAARPGERGRRRGPPPRAPGRLGLSPRRGGAGDLLAAARILAAADVYHALTEQRPHRAGLTRPLARARAGGARGRLDGDAVAAVLQAAGLRSARRRARPPAGLTEREVEVLRSRARV